jgi:hypothetical protein
MHIPLCRYYVQMCTFSCWLERGWAAGTVRTVAIEIWIVLRNNFMKLTKRTKIEFVCHGFDWQRMSGDWIEVVLIYWVGHFIYSVWHILRGMARRLWYMPNWIGTTPHRHLPLRQIYVVCGECIWKGGKRREVGRKVDKQLIRVVPGSTPGRRYFCLAFCRLTPTLIAPKM